MVSIVKGKLYQCLKDPIDPEFRNLVISKWDCLNYGGFWDKRNEFFDSFVLSVQTFLDFTSGDALRVFWLMTDHVG